MLTLDFEIAVLQFVSASMLEDFCNTDSKQQRSLTPWKIKIRNPVPSMLINVEFLAMESKFDSVLFSDAEETFLLAESGFLIERLVCMTWRVIATS